MQPANRAETVVFYMFKLLGHSAILFNGPPKPGACWSGRSQGKCEELILTMVAHRYLGSNPSSNGGKPSAFTAELSCYPPTPVRVPVGYE